jgi:hypothetical protein
MDKMKQKIFMSFSRLTCTREELSDVLEQAAIGLREGHNGGRVLVGETGSCYWRLYPTRYDEANTQIVRRQSEEGFARACAGGFRSS